MVFNFNLTNLFHMSYNILHQALKISVLDSCKDYVGSVIYISAMARKLIAYY